MSPHEIFILIKGCYLAEKQGIITSRYYKDMLFDIFLNSIKGENK